MAGGKEQNAIIRTQVSKCCFKISNKNTIRSYSARRQLFCGSLISSCLRLQTSNDALVCYQATHQTAVSFHKQFIPHPNCNSARLVQCTPLSAFIATQYPFSAILRSLLATSNHKRFPKAIGLHCIYAIFTCLLSSQCLMSFLADVSFCLTREPSL